MADGAAEQEEAALRRAEKESTITITITIYPDPDSPTYAHRQPGVNAPNTPQHRRSAMVSHHACE
eukprot:2927668-Prymnesium_polylepis.1